MKTLLKILSREMVSPGKLTAHPDADIPIGEEVRQALYKSLDEHGQAEEVLALKNGQIIGGVNRWRWATERQKDTMAVAWVECPDPRAYVLSAQTRRSSSVSQLLLLHLEKEPSEVATYWRLSQQQQRMIGCTLHDAAKALNLRVSAAKCEELAAQYAGDAIAQEIGCDPKTATEAVGFVAHYHLRIRATVDAKNPKREIGAELDLKDPADKSAWDSMVLAREKILSGEAGVQKWKVVLGGLSQATSAGKAPTNHVAVAERAITGLTNVFEGKVWGRLPGKKRDELIDNVAAMIGKLVRLDGSAADRLRAQLDLEASA